MRDIIVWIYSMIPNNNITPENPDPEERIRTGTHTAQRYFERMSMATAMLCSGQIVSIHKNVDNIPAAGIFRQVELETIKRKMVSTPVH